MGGIDDGSGWAMIPSANEADEAMRTSAIWVLGWGELFLARETAS